MLLGKALRQQRIANRAGKGDIKNAADVDMTNLRAAETEFSAAEAVRMNRYLRPRGNFLFQPRQMLHTFNNLTAVFFRCPATVRRFSWPVNGRAKSQEPLSTSSE